MILAGIRVIDWSVMHAGPYAAAMLADLGAEVIHLEDPKRGDASRGVTTLYGQPAALPGGRHVLFEEYNRNKKSIAINLKHQDGREAIYRLTERSDVFLTNYRPNAAARFGVDYETLQRYNPKLIYARGSGYGFQGPRKDLPSFDLIAQAMSGMMLSSGEEGAPPVFLTPGLGDRLTALCLAYGVIAALLARERLGIAQQVDVSQLGSMSLLQGSHLAQALLLGWTYPRHNRIRPHRNPLYNSYACSDGKWIVMDISREEYWPSLCEVIGRADLAKDPRFADEPSRMKHREELVRILDEVFAKKTAAEWEAIVHGGADVPFSAVKTVGELAYDEQMAANGYVVDWDHPVLGKIKFPGFPIQFSETPPSLNAPAPELGQHTEEILTQVCGYSWDDITELQERGVIP